MDTRKLATFVDLAATLNYTETAGRLYTTQATVSKHIMSLEKELNVTLFNRDHRQVILTEAGRLALPYAAMIVSAEGKLLQTLSAHDSAAKLRLIIHTIPSISQYRAFNTIAAFSKQHPEVDLRFAEAESNTLLPSLEVNSADIVFTRLFELEHSKYDVAIEAKDRFVALLPKDHPLAAADHVTIEQLAHDPFMLLDEATNLYTPVVNLMQAAGVAPAIIYKGRRIDLILGMVNRGMGVSIMMARSFDPTDYPAVAVVPITPEKVSHLAFVRIHDQPHSHASDLFWQFVQSQRRG